MQFGKDTPLDELVLCGTIEDWTQGLVQAKYLSTVSDLYAVCFLISRQSLAQGQAFLKPAHTLLHLQGT